MVNFNSIFHLYSFLFLEAFDIPATKSFNKQPYLVRDFVARAVRVNMALSNTPSTFSEDSSAAVPFTSGEILDCCSNESCSSILLQRQLDPPPVVVGIAGGSASGKTTLASKIKEALGEDHVSFINHDNYYKDMRSLSIEERSRINFDHPDSLDTELLISHVERLKKGEHVEIPTYDFTTHARALETIKIAPKRIILVDGILIFSDPKLLSQMDMKIFVDTDDDIRLIRRIQRDTNERGRSVDSVIEQYTKTVRPMHQLFVEPSKRLADIIVPAGSGIQDVALHMCVSRLREIINFYQ